jgi:hypothetical protein
MLHNAQHVVQAHDGHGLDVPALAQPRAQKRMRQLLLRGGHVFHGQPFAGLRDEMPVQALVILEFERRLGALLRREGIQKSNGAVRHDGCRMHPVISRTQENDAHGDRKQTHLAGIQDDFSLSTL